jgi:hypothetical protein
MSITVHCPQGHAIKVDDAAPSDVACPRCGTVFAVDASPDPDPFDLPAGMAARPESRKSRDDEEDEDDRPRKRKPRADEEDDEPPRRRKPRREEEDDEEEFEDEPEEAVPLTRRQRKMATVRLGILFHILKLWTYLGAMLFGFITLPLVLFASVVFGSWVGTILSQITFNLAMTLAPIFGIIGSIMCAFVPPRSEARGTIIVSIIFDLIAPVFGVLQLIMVLAYWGLGDERVERLIDYMFFARMACTLVAWWLFQLYLRKVSFYMHESLLASESLNLIVHFLIGMVIGPTLLALMFAILVFFPLIPILLIVMFFATLGWSIYFNITFPIRQFRLLFLMRNRIYVKYLKPDDD